VAMGAITGSSSSPEGLKARLLGVLGLSDTKELSDRWFEGGPRLSSLKKSDSNILYERNRGIEV
jgi:hypothetical protein